MKSLEEVRGFTTFNRRHYDGSQLAARAAEVGFLDLRISPSSLSVVAGYSVSCGRSSMRVVA